jgi:hypothetical protein
MVTLTFARRQPSRELLHVQRGAGCGHSMCLRVNDELKSWICKHVACCWIVHGMGLSCCAINPRHGCCWVCGAGHVWRCRGDGQLAIITRWATRSWRPSGGSEVWDCLGRGCSVTDQFGPGQQLMVACRSVVTFVAIVTPSSRGSAFLNGRAFDIHRTARR